MSGLFPVIMVVRFRNVALEAQQLKDELIPYDVSPSVHQSVLFLLKQHLRHTNYPVLKLELMESLITVTRKYRGQNTVTILLICVERLLQHQEIIDKQNCPNATVA